MLHSCGAIFCLFPLLMYLFSSCFPISCSSFFPVEGISAEEDLAEDRNSVRPSVLVCLLPCSSLCVVNTSEKREKLQVFHFCPEPLQSLFQ
ncbi:hypothetical protein DPEC_G00277410 [Dallia pectoralis]|uniref:Uncharacterized protein n=1 Tax=Dallia pectoralis TaxID=75939 RepID=A0ACC2FM75_DALPE|nr:hypothetical protein DPEC_G00277410 [Dallia pectoralis]